MTLHLHFTFDERCSTRCSHHAFESIFTRKSEFAPAVFLISQPKHHIANSQPPLHSPTTPSNSLSCHKYASGV